MLRFYTIADSKKSLHRLYSVESIEDYKASIQNLNIDIKKMQEVNQVHQDYSFAEKYICEQIEIAERVVFVGVYDVSLIIGVYVKNSPAPDVDHTPWKMFGISS